jgi:hypothetical protein
MRVKREFAALAAVVIFLSAAVALFISAEKDAFYFEVSMRSSQPGSAQLFYDTGKGFNEAESVRNPVRKSELQWTYRFALRPAVYRSFRFDPIDHGDCKVTIYHVAIRDSSGRLVRNFPIGEFTDFHDVSTAGSASTELNLTLASSDADPHVTVNLSPVLTLRSSVWILIRSATTPFLYCFVASAIVGLLWVRWSVRGPPPVIQRIGRRFRNWCRLRPRRALLVVACAGVALSCYPIIFFGRSYAGANIVPMLYAFEPTLPGSEDAEAEDFHGADTGAMMWQNLPYSFVQSRALAHAELPLWNRYNSSGTPLLAQGLSMFGDPLHMLVLAAGGSAWAWDVKYLLAKILFCWGMGLLVLTSTRHVPSALLLGCSSAFIGFFSFRFNHPAFFSMCYAPWLLLSWLEIIKATTARKTARWAGLLVLVSWAELNSGSAKEAYMLLLSLHGCGLLAFLLVPSVTRWRKLLDLAVAGVAFLLLSTPVCLTFWETLKTSYTAYKGAVAFQIQPGLLIGLFDDIFYRAVNAAGSVYDPAANFLVLLGCIFAAVYLRRLLRDRLFVAVGLGALASFALAFGAVPSDLISRVPILNNVWHLDNTFSCALIIELEILAGFGFRCYWERAGRQTWKLDFSLMTIVLFALLAAYIGLTNVIQRAPNIFAPLGEAGGRDRFFYFYGASIIAALLALPWLGRALLLRSKLAPLAALFAFLCFASLHWRNGFQLNTGIVEIDATVVTPPSRVNLRASSRAISFVENEPGVFRTVGFGNYLFAGYSGLVGLEGITGPDPLMNPYYRELLSSAGVKLDMTWRWVVEKATLESTLPLYNLLNIRYFLDAPQRTTGPGASLTSAASLDLEVYKNDGAWPRAFFVDEIRTYDTVGRFIEMVRAAPNRPLAAVQQNDIPATAATRALVKSEGGHLPVSARNYRLTNNTTTFTVDAPAPGVVILTETYLADDFIARVNGIRNEYFRVNHAFRGIAIPAAGTYVISFSYWPKHFTIALWLAGGGASLLAGWLVFAYRTRKDQLALAGRPQAS